MNIPTTPERFKAKLDIFSPAPVHQPSLGNCWEWKGSKNNTGYGKSSLKSKPMLCHRISHVLFIGPIPPGAQVLHKCDNPACCRPAHLFLGNHRSNMKDMWAKRRHQSNRGEENGRAILTKERADQIRMCYKNREMNQVQLAKRFGVSQPTISLVVRNELWN
jgi:predicted XRE-type DNA-binding protein